MAILKLNEEKMTKRKKPKKPTNNDIVAVINGLIQEMNMVKTDMNAFVGTLDLYIDFKKDGKSFKEFIDSKINSQKKDDNELQSAGQGDTVANTADSTN